MLWKMFWRVSLVSSFVLIVSVAFAGSSASQVVTFSVIPVNEIGVSGSPGALAVTAPAAGNQPIQAVDTSTSYSISSNGTDMKITGSIDTAMPSGVTLKINLAAPTGGTSAGDVPLGVTPSSLVTGTTKVAESGKAITYKLDATVSAGVLPTANKTVTLTVTDGN